MAKITSKGQKEIISEKEKFQNNDDTFGYEAELIYKESQKLNYENFLESRRAEEKNEANYKYLAEIYPSVKESFEKKAKTFFNYEYQLRTKLEGDEMNQMMAEVRKEAKTHWEFIMVSLHRSQNRNQTQEQNSEDFAHNWLVMAFEDSLGKNDIYIDDSIEQTIELLTNWPRILKAEVVAAVKSLIEYFNSVPFDAILDKISKCLSQLENKEETTQSKNQSKKYKKIEHNK